MNTNIGLERCLSFINCQLTPPSPAHGAREPKRAITISRQAGCGGHTLADLLVAKLQAAAPPESCPWTVFDRNLVERVLEDHHLPSRLAKFMPEDRISEISDTMDELFGLHPSSWTLVHKTADTILRLAELGHVILIGRGAALITHRLPYVLHVRLVGSVEKRAKHMHQVEHLSLEEALRWVQQEDLARKRYLKKYFNRDIDDPLLYHLVINTDLIACEEAARMIVQAVLPQPVAA